MALLAKMTSTAFGEACTQDTFCERWMCKQNANRRARIEKWLGTSYTDADLATCNTQQEGAANLLVSTCTIATANPPTLAVGMKYDKSTCSQDEPPQLLVIDPKTGTNKLAVKAESNALVKNQKSKNDESTKLYDNQKGKCGTAGFTPIVPCICDASVAKSVCERSIRTDVFFNPSTVYFRRFANEYTQILSNEFITLGVTSPADAPKAASLNCDKRYGEGCASFSPAIQTRRRTLRRTL